MARRPKPYLKIERDGNDVQVTAYASTPNGHRRVGQVLSVRNDRQKLKADVESLVTAVRGGGA